MDVTIGIVIEPGDTVGRCEGRRLTGGHYMKPSLVFKDVVIRSNDVPALRELIDALEWLEAQGDKAPSSADAPQEVTG